MVPIIVLVPGICSIGTVIYAPLKSKLESLGFPEIISLNLPNTIHSGNPSNLKPNPLLADIEYIRSIIESLVNTGKDVIVAGHSYGGTPSLYACEGLWKHSRVEQGLQGGVIKAALISSTITLPNTVFAESRGGWCAEHAPELLKAEQSAKVAMNDDMPVLQDDDLGPFFFSDMPAEKQIEWATKGLTPSPLGCVLNPTPDGTVKDWKIAYLLTEDIDPTMPNAFQEFLISNAKERGAIIEPVTRIKSGHFVQITHVDETAKWIKDLAAPA